MLGARPNLRSIECLFTGWGQIWISSDSSPYWTRPKTCKSKQLNTEYEGFLKFFSNLRTEDLILRAGDNECFLNAVAVPSQLGNLDTKNISLPEKNSFPENVKDITHYYLNQVEVIPDQDLILRVTVGAGVLRPGQVENLKTLVQLVSTRLKIW